MNGTADLSTEDENRQNRKLIIKHLMVFFFSVIEEVDTSRKHDNNSFCLSASKMAFSFAILGAIFLCGVLAALWTVMRNNLRKANKMDGSEQILVVRDSPMSFMNQRNKSYHWTYS